MTVTLGPGGEMSFRVGEVVTLEDGRELRRVEGSRYRLLSETEAAAAPREIAGLDVLLQAESLKGSRVRVTEGTFIGADAERGMLNVQGGSIFVRFGGAAVDAIREVVQRCSGFSRSDVCRYAVTGTVRTQSFGGPELINPVLEPLRPTAATLRR